MVGRQLAISDTTARLGHVPGNALVGQAANPFSNTDAPDLALSAPQQVQGSRKVLLQDAALSEL